jgi:signal transduction histidine kinase
MKKKINNVMQKTINKSKLVWKIITVNPSWRVELITLFVVILVTSFLLQLLYVIPWLENRETHDTQENQSTITYNIARELDLNLNDVKNLLLDLANRPEFKNMDVPAQQATISKYVEVLPAISSISVMNTEEVYVYSTGANLVGTKSVTYADILPFIQNEVFFGLAYFWNYESKSNVSTHIIVPIMSDTGERAGFLLGGLDLRNIITEIRDYPIEIGTSVFLVDHNGTVVAQTGVDMFTLIGGPLSINYSSQPMVKIALDGTIKWGSSGSGEYSYNDNRYFGTYTTLESNGWAVVASTPMQTITDENTLLRTNLLWINIGIFLVALFVTLIFTNQITLYRKRTENQLMKYKNHLEELVSLRTQEITTTNKRLESEVAKNEQAGKEIQDLYMEEQKLRLALEERMKQRVEFSRIIVHELKSPLTSLKVANDLLSERADVEPYNSLAHSIDKSVDRLGHRIDEILDIARGEVGLLTLKRHMVNPAELFSSLQVELLPVVKAESKILVVDIQSNLPAVLIDGERISQVIYNLVDNALKYTSEGGRIFISVITEDGNLIIKVKDDGCGIDKDKLSDIFDHSINRRREVHPYGGFGLGLTLSKMIVKLHKGSIWVESELGKGSTLTFSIPIAENT